MKQLSKEQKESIRLYPMPFFEGVSCHNISFSYINPVWTKEECKAFENGYFCAKENMEDEAQKLNFQFQMESLDAVSKKIDELNHVQNRG